jgi:hypothetical protein
MGEHFASVHAFCYNHEIGPEITILRDFTRFHLISTRFHPFLIFSNDSARKACFDS